MSERKFHVLIWGATGYTGSLVAEYFAKSAPKNLKWGIAGRDAAKLQKVKESLISIDPQLKDLEIILGNSSNEASLAELCKQTKVIITTVGPYQKYGTSLVEACVKHKTDYVDLTGEAPWIKSIVDKYHQQAMQNGVLIVTCCGFDSIPSDLGTFLVVDYIKKKFNKNTAQVKNVLMKMKGGVSGGTVASLMEMLEYVPAAELKSSRDPYYLAPGGQRGPDVPEFPFPFAYDNVLNTWTTPFIMASLNTRVVRRSNHLLNNSYGGSFSYSEVQAAKGFFMGLLFTIVFAIVIILLMFKPTRGLLKKVLPTPGEGPSKIDRETGFFKFIVYGTPQTEKGEKPEIVKAEVVGVQDPGYGETAKMISESAICLALQRHELTGIQGGIVTPASAMGMTLIERLRKAGMTFKIISPA